MVVYVSYLPSQAGQWSQSMLFRVNGNSVEAELTHARPCSISCATTWTSTGRRRVATKARAAALWIERAKAIHLTWAGQRLAPQNREGIFVPWLRETQRFIGCFLQGFWPGFQVGRQEVLASHWMGRSMDCTARVRWLKSIVPRSSDGRW